MLNPALQSVSANQHHFVGVALCQRMCVCYCSLGSSERLARVRHKTPHNMLCAGNMWLLRLLRCTTPCLHSHTFSNVCGVVAASQPGLPRRLLQTQSLHVGACLAFVAVCVCEATETGERCINTSHGAVRWLLVLRIGGEQKGGGVLSRADRRE